MASSSSSSSWTEYRRPPEQPFTSSPLRTAAAAAAAATTTAKPQASWSAIVTKSNVSPGDDDDDDRKSINANSINGMTSIPPLPLYDTPIEEEEGYTTTTHTTTAVTAMSTTMNRSDPQIISSPQHLFKRSATLSIDNHDRSNTTTTKHALSTPNGTFRRYDSAPISSSSTTATTTNTSELDSIVHTIHQHSKLDCRTSNNDNHIVYYSCCVVNGCTPLGMEYISDHIIVNLDYYPTTTGGRRTWTRMENNNNNNEYTMNNDSNINNHIAVVTTTTTTLVEYVVVIIVRLNQASLQYNQTTTTLASGDVGDCDDDGLCNILSILELAVKDCHRAIEIINNNNGSNNDVRGGGRNSDDGRRLCVIVNLLRLLEVIVQSNIGTVNYRLNKIRESLTSYEIAMAILDRFSDDDEEKWHYDNNNNNNNEFYHTNNNDNRIPSRDYLLLVIRMNLSRVLLRLKRTDDATRYRDDMICVHNNDRLQQHHRKTKMSLLHRSRLSSSSTTAALLAHEHDMDRRINWLHSVAEHYITGLIYETKGAMADDYKLAYQHYNHLLSIARVKLDHRHPYICTILERRGAVLFEQRKLQCSMLSYLACLKIIEYQQSTNSIYFNVANLSRILYAVARVLHDKEEYHDALHIYQRALKCQRSLANISGRPTTLDVITTLCNISRVHHLSGEIDAALSANREVLELTLTMVGGRVDHPFLIHRLKFEGMSISHLSSSFSSFCY